MFSPLWLSLVHTHTHAQYETTTPSMKRRNNHRSPPPSARVPVSDRIGDRLRREPAFILVVGFKGPEMRVDRSCHGCRFACVSEPEKYLFGSIKHPKTCGRQPQQQKTRLALRTASLFCYFTCLPEVHTSDTNFLLPISSGVFIPL